MGNCRETRRERRSLRGTWASSATAPCVALPPASLQSRPSRRAQGAGVGMEGRSLECSPRELGLIKHQTQLDWHCSYIVRQRIQYPLVTIS